MRRTDVLAAMTLTALALAVSACGWRLPDEVTPDYHDYARWTAAPEAAASADVTSAAMALIPRYSGDDTPSAVATSRAATASAGTARLDRIIPQYRIAASGEGLQPLGSYVVAFTTLHGRFGAFSLRREAGGWTSSADSYPDTWLRSDLEAIDRQTPQPTRLLLVPLAAPLSWWLVEDGESTYAYPAMYMGSVSIAPDGSDRWQRMRWQRYPWDVVFWRVRAGG